MCPHYSTVSNTACWLALHPLEFAAYPHREVSMKISGNTMLITGASYGIGAALARMAAQVGGHVVLLARTRDALDQVAAEVRAGGGQASVYQVDLADAGAVERAALAITNEVGTPDILVNNAGVGRWLFLEETEPAEAQAMMAVPYFAALYVTR